MKQYIVLLFFFSAFNAYAGVKGKVINQKGEAIPNANVKWLNTGSGTVTDEKGEFEIARHNDAAKLIISFIGYTNDTINVIDDSFRTVTLTDKIELTELNVVGRNTGTTKSRVAIFNTEKINAAELCKAACCNLSESFETNPSVDVSYSDAATGAKQIKLLGLPGTYVQMLTENIPNLRGISAPYGLSFIPGPWMESIQVSKGTSSVINGYESLTGQINVEYKKPPTSEKIAFNLFASDAGRVESNLNATVHFNNKLSTGILLHASDEYTASDHNHDNFIDMPMTRQYNFINRWYYKSDKFMSQAFVRALNENRNGGQINGNYKIDIESERLEFFLKNALIFNNATGESVALILSGSTHGQQSLYGNKSYKGRQNSIYSNLLYQTQWTDKHKLTSGVSLTYDYFKERMPSVQQTETEKNELITGIYSEYSFKPTDALLLMAGIRFDHNSLYGNLFTPRLHAKYSLSDDFTIRASVGKGYRSPNIMAENNNMLASNRQIIIANNLKMEDAWNYGLSIMYDIHLGSKDLKLNGEWYFTNFNEQVVMDMDTNPHEVRFTNLNGKSYSHSAQIEASMELVKGLSLNVAHRINIVKTTINNVLRDKPLTNKSKSLFTASYQTPLKKWQFDYTLQLNGGGRMPDPSVSQPLWSKTFDPYTVMNAQITKYFKTWSIYAGSENLTNFTQMHPIIDVENPGSNNFDATLIWGPLHQRKFYIGFRWALDRI